MDHDCKSSLDSIPDENAPKPWPMRKLIGVKNITARIGPTGGKRGYEAQTGKFTAIIINDERSHAHMFVSTKPKVHRLGGLRGI